jgi:hypothetical protein
MGYCKELQLWKRRSHIWFFQRLNSGLTHRPWRSKAGWILIPFWFLFFLTLDQVYVSLVQFWCSSTKCQGLLLWASLPLSPFAAVVLLRRKLVNGMCAKAGEPVQRAIASGKLWQKLQILLPVDQCQDNYLDIEPRFNLLLFCDSSE